LPSILRYQTRYLISGPAGKSNLAPQVLEARLVAKAGEFAEVQVVSDHRIVLFVHSLERVQRPASFAQTCPDERLHLVRRRDRLKHFPRRVLPVGDSIGKAQEAVNNWRMILENPNRLLLHPFVQISTAERLCSQTVIWFDGQHLLGKL
jgi:hypothetical protein